MIKELGMLLTGYYGNDITTAKSHQVLSRSPKTTSYEFLTAHWRSIISFAVQCSDFHLKNANQYSMCLCPTMVSRQIHNTTLCN
jgi:hypothetical protein